MCMCDITCSHKSVADLPIFKNMLPPCQNLPAAGQAGSSFTLMCGQYRTGKEHRFQKDSGSLES